MGTQLDMCFLRPTRVHNPNGISIVSAVLPQFMAENPYTYSGFFFPPKLPLTMGISGPHLIHGSLHPPEFSTQIASRSVQPFLPRLPQSVSTLYNGMLLPHSKLPFPMWHLDPHLIRGSLDPPESSTQKALFLQVSLV